jgi:hypothetical protein
VVAIDLPAALELAAARAYELSVLSELLSAAQFGFVDALWGRTRGGMSEV